MRDMLNRHDADDHQTSSNSGQQQGAILPPPTFPMQVARAFVAQNCVEDGELTLRYWRDGWWEWKYSHWAEVEYRQIKSSLYRFTEHAVYQTDDGPVSWAPTRRKIGDLLEAMQAICILPESTDQPCWLDGTENGVIVALKNGLLDVENRVLLPHNVRFFNTTAVNFNYDLNAPKPVRWLTFLNEVWPADEGGDAPIKVLGEWFGYVLSGRTDLHKMFLQVGPTRGGKGLIGRVETALLGKNNVAGPTLNSFGGDFGLAPLIGKSLAVISDARFGRADSVVVERLLSISGEDTLTINRKFRDHWTGKLPTRVHMISNEFPKLGDASTAIIGRLVLLMSSKSWLGKEDVTLEDAILEELPGILNFALDGLQRLVENGNRFTRVPAFDEAIVEMRDLASPVAAFVRQSCKLGNDKDGKPLTIKVDDLYAAFKAWAEANGHPRIAKETFGRDLLALPQGFRKSHPREDGERVYKYVGLDIRIEPDPADTASAANNKDQPVPPVPPRPGTGGTGSASLLADPETVTETTLDPRFQIVAKAPRNVPCVQCGIICGEIFKIRDTRQGAHGNVDVLHEGCAEDWFEAKGA
jgi:putative DNA primase/helicase